MLLKDQDRIFQNLYGMGDRSLKGAMSRGCWDNTAELIARGRDKIIDEMKASGLRGRGGAGFPTGLKWSFMPKESDGRPSYLVINGDESEPATCKDREIMRHDPHTLIEGALVASFAMGAHAAYIYIRGEFIREREALQAAIDECYDAGLLGRNAAGSGWDFDLYVHSGAGAYICGEETALLESLEGRRGIVRAKPPLPAISGLFGQPTAINNVITFGSVPDILARGASHYHELGCGRSRGTLPFQLAGNVKYGGLVEVPFGLTLRELLYDFGGGSRSGRPLRAVQVGGPLGAYLPESQFDTPLDYEAFAAIGAGLGHGGIVAFDDRVDMAKQARYAMKFCAIASCGKCTPCRIGSTRGVEVIDRIRAGHGGQIELLEDLCETMVQGSACAMGSMTPIPVMSALRHFAGDFG